MRTVSRSSVKGLAAAVVLALCVMMLSTFVPIASADTANIRWGQSVGDSKRLVNIHHAPDAGIYAVCGGDSQNGPGAAGRTPVPANRVVVTRAGQYRFGNTAHGFWRGKPVPGNSGDFYPLAYVLSEIVPTAGRGGNTHEAAAAVYATTVLTHGRESSTVKATASEKARGNQMIAEARRLAGPYSAQGTMDVAPGGQSAVLRGLGIKAASGAWMTSWGYTVTLSGPVTFADGSKTKNFNTRNGGEDVNVIVTGAGDARATIARNGLPSTSFIVYEMKKYQDVLGAGAKTNVVRSTRDHPVQAGFNPITETNASQGPGENGELVDRVRVKPKAGEQWPRVGNEFVPVTVKVNAWKSPVKAAQSSTMPADSVKLGEKTLIFQPKSYKEATEGVLQVVTMDERQTEATHYYFTADIDKATQPEKWRKYFLAGYTAPHFEPIESHVVPIKARVSTEVQSVLVKAGDKLIDTALVESDNGWIKDANAKLTFKAYGPFDKQPVRAAAVPADAPLVGTEEVAVAAPGKFVSPGTLVAKTPGYYTFVATLTADEKMLAGPVSHDFGMVEETSIVPGLHTTATDGVDGDKLIDLSTGTVTVNDRVEYGPVIPGKPYSLTATAHYKDDGKALECEGKPVVVEHAFTPEAASGFEDVVVSVPASCVQEKPFVMFESLKQDGREIAIHADLNDEGQTVYPVKVSSLAWDNADGDQIIVGATPERADIVGLSGKVPADTKVKIVTKLADAASGEVLKCEGKEAAWETQATLFANEADAAALDLGAVEPSPEGVFATAQQIKVETPINSACTAGKTTVYYEYVYDAASGKLIAKHEDKNDKAQMLYHPRLSTMATDKADGNKVINSKADQVLMDQVKHESLPAGMKCYTQGVLMDVNSKSPLMLGGKEVTGRSEFISKGGVEAIAVDYKFDASTLAGKTLNVFEETYCNGKFVGEHKDLTDENQTVKIVDEDGGDGDLAETGANTLPLLLGAGGAAALGSALLAAARRKRK